jgi:hypothetical protein
VVTGGQQFHEADEQGFTMRSKLIAVQSLCALAALVLTVAAPWKW